MLYQADPCEVLEEAQSRRSSDCSSCVAVGRIRQLPASRNGRPESSVGRLFDHCTWHFKPKRCSEAEDPAEVLEILEVGSTNSCLSLWQAAAVDAASSHDVHSLGAVAQRPMEVVAMCSGRALASLELAGGDESCVRGALSMS